MKIVQVPHLYRPHLGGIENYVYRLKKSLESRGHEVEVFTSDIGVEEGSEVEEDTYYCDTFVAPFRNPVCFDLLDKVRESEADIYHIHSPWFITSYFTTLALPSEKSKVMTVHSARLQGYDMKTRILSKVYRPFANYVLEEMDKLIALSSDEKSDLVELFSTPEDKVKVIPNGIIPGDFSVEEGSKEGFVGKFGLSEDSFKILYISRMVSEKNQKSLVEAVVNHLEGKNVELILIGGGEDEYVEELEELSDDRVHILGRLDFEDLVSAYHASDLFVFLGTWEGLPTVIMEAMVCGLPLITTPAGGIPDLIEDGENGFYVPLPVPSDELAGKIKRFLEMDISELEGFGERNENKIRNSYNWENIADRILETYEEVL